MPLAVCATNIRTYDYSLSTTCDTTTISVDVSGMGEGLTQHFTLALVLITH